MLKVNTQMPLHEPMPQPKDYSDTLEALNQSEREIQSPYSQTKKAIFNAIIQQMSSIDALIESLKHWHQLKLIEKQELQLRIEKELEKNENKALTPAQLVELNKLLAQLQLIEKQISDLVKKIGEKEAQLVELKAQSADLQQQYHAVVAQLNTAKAAFNTAHASCQAQLNSTLQNAFQTGNAPAGLQVQNISRYVTLLSDPAAWVANLSPAIAPVQNHSGTFVPPSQSFVSAPSVPVFRETFAPVAAPLATNSFTPDLSAPAIQPEFEPELEEITSDDSIISQDIPNLSELTVPPRGLSQSHLAGPSFSAGTVTRAEEKEIEIIRKAIPQLLPILEQLGIDAKRLRALEVHREELRDRNTMLVFTQGNVSNEMKAIASQIASHGKSANDIAEYVSRNFGGQFQVVNVSGR